MATSNPRGEMDQGRRQFLFATGTAAVAAGLGPLVAAGPGRRRPVR